MNPAVLESLYCPYQAPAPASVLCVTSENRISSIQDSLSARMNFRMTFSYPTSWAARMPVPGRTAVLSVRGAVVFQNCCFAKSAIFLCL